VGGTDIELVVPDVGRHQEWLEMADEFLGQRIEGGAMDSVSVDDLRNPDRFAAWVRTLLDNERGESLPEGYVPGSSRWIAENGRLVGFVSIRHELNDWLREVGGHIGYAVRPSARRRGIATAATALALEECRRRGIDRVLITCDDDNLASATVIERNGGVLEDVRNGKRRYWIALPA
jgi:predicted acetyltransferase